MNFNIKNYPNKNQNKIDNESGNENANEYENESKILRKNEFNFSRFITDDFMRNIELSKSRSMLCDKSKSTNENKNENDYNINIKDSLSHGASEKNSSLNKLSIDTLNLDRLIKIFVNDDNENNTSSIFLNEIRHGFGNGNKKLETVEYSFLKRDFEKTIKQDEDLKNLNLNQKNLFDESSSNEFNEFRVKKEVEEKKIFQTLDNFKYLNCPEKNNQIIENNEKHNQNQNQNFGTFDNRNKEKVFKQPIQIQYGKYGTNIHNHPANSPLRLTNYKLSPIKNSSKFTFPQISQNYPVKNKNKIDFNFNTKVNFKAKSSKNIGTNQLFNLNFNSSYSKVGLVRNASVNTLAAFNNLPTNNNLYLKLNFNSNSPIFSHYPYNQTKKFSKSIPHVTSDIDNIQRIIYNSSKYLNKNQNLIPRHSIPSKTKQRLIFNISPERRKRSNPEVKIRRDEFRNIIPDKRGFMINLN